MDRELRAGEMTWRTFKEQMGIKGVDDDSVVRFLHLRTQEPADMTVFALGTSEEKDSVFEFGKSDESELIELKSRIKYLTEDLDKLRKESEEDKYNNHVLRDQLQSLTDLLCKCQDRLVKAVFHGEVEIPEKSKSMEIIIKNYPSFFPQDIKWMILERGFKYAGAKQVDKDTVEMKFEKKE